MFKHGINNKGVSVVEYALLAALIGTASVLAVTTFGAQTASLFEREDLRLADSNGGGDNGSGGSTGSGDGLGDHRATQNLDMSLFRIVNINEPLNPSDAATKGYVDTTVASISTQGDDLGSHTATQNLDLATNRIVNLGAPQDPADATTKAYVDAAVAGIPGGDDLGNHTATQNIVLGNNWLSGDGDNEGVFVAGNGNVGIGTVTPDFKLDVSGGGIGLEDGEFLQFQNGTGILRAGISATAADSLTLHTGPGNAERVRIDDVGNVGIGVNAPISRLDVRGAEGLLAQFFETSSGNNRRFRFLSSGGLNTIESTTGVGTSTLAFRVDGQERMRFASGNILIAATDQDSLAPGFRFYPTGSGNGHFASFVNGGVGGSNMVLANSNPSTSSWTSIFFFRGQSAVGSITHSGSGTAYNTTSDYRLKEDFSPIENALDRIRRLSPQSFVFKSDERRQVVEGFVAHEVAEIAPYAVTGERDAVDDNGEPRYQQVDYGKLTPLLTAALIEANYRVDALSSELASLRETNEKLLARVEALEQRAVNPKRRSWKAP